MWWWLNNADFRAGVEDYRSGAGWRELGSGQGWRYEYGRLFAAHCAARGFKFVLPPPRCRKAIYGDVALALVELEMRSALGSSIPQGR